MMKGTGPASSSACSELSSSLETSANKNANALFLHTSQKTLKYIR